VNEATPLNLERLIKLLKLSASPNDSEALAAVRKANDVLARSFGDWDSLLRGKVTIIEDPFNSIKAPPRRDTPREAPSPPQRPAPPQPKPAPPPPPKPQPKPHANTTGDGFDWYDAFGGDAANPNMGTSRPQRRQAAAQRTAQVVPQAKPKFNPQLPSFTKSKTGDWCVRSATGLKPGQFVDITTRNGGIKRVEIIGPYTVNDFGDWLYTFRDAPARPLDDLA
jgi:cell division septation protein DedD